MLSLTLLGASAANKRRKIFHMLAACLFVRYLIANISKRETGEQGLTSYEISRTNQNQSQSILKKLWKK